MYTIPAFGSWQEHESTADDQTRLKSAQTSKLTPISVDKEKQCGVFYGSSKDPYHTDLGFCPCGDFRKRKLPCKHIFRLAMELGIIDLPHKTGENKGEILERQLAFADCIDLVEALSADAQAVLLQMLSTTAPSVATRHESYLVDNESVAAEFRSSPLFEEKPYPLHEVLSRMGRADLLAFIDDHAEADAVKPKRNASKAVLSDWIVTNIPDCQRNLPTAFSFAFIVNFDMRQTAVQKYLNRKYLTDDYGSIYGTPIPHGSILAQNGTYFFPDDEITTQLTKHGCNRCLNGYIPATN